MAEHKVLMEEVQGHKQTLQNSNEELKIKIKVIEGDLEVRLYVYLVY